MYRCDGPKQNDVAVGNKDDFSRAMESLRLFEVGPPFNGLASYNAKFEFKNDHSQLFPYIKSVCESARQSLQPPYIRFLFEDRQCLLHPKQGVFGCVEDLAEAIDILRNLFSFLYAIEQRREQLTPNFRSYATNSPIEIYKLLPGTNCAKCGYSTCVAYAAALSRQLTTIFHCPYLGSPCEETVTFQARSLEDGNTQNISISMDTSFLFQQMKEQQSEIHALKEKLADVQNEQNATTGAFSTINGALLDPLTEREIEILKILTIGKTNKQISRLLHISQNTVKTHVHHIFSKLGVNDRTKASVWAVRHGLV